MAHIKLEIESKIPKELFQVLASVGFWNKEGNDIYNLNKAEKLGNKASQQRAKTMVYNDFIMDCLYHDIKTLAESKPDSGYWPEGFKFGKGGSHIWVSDKDNIRTLFIHF